MELALAQADDTDGIASNYVSGSARIAPNYGTARMAQSFGAIALSFLAPSQSQSESSLFALLRPPIAEEREIPSRTSVSTVANSTSAINIDALSGVSRETTLQEHLIGELRSWKLLSSNWDGENAAAPIAESIDGAVAFAQLLDADSMAEPMLHANGRAGLYWKDTDLYADIEFLGSGRIAYYIECKGDKHKGAVNFDATEMPPVLKAVLPA